MPKKDKEVITQSTDAFEFIGRMAQERKKVSVQVEKTSLEELESRDSCDSKLLRHN